MTTLYDWLNYVMCVVAIVGYGACVGAYVVGKVKFTNNVNDMTFSDWASAANDLLSSEQDAGLVEWTECEGLELCEELSSETVGWTETDCDDVYDNEPKQSIEAFESSLVDDSDWVDATIKRYTVHEQNKMRERLSADTIRSLKAYCRDYDIKGYSNLCKADLIEHIVTWSWS